MSSLLLKQFDVIICWTHLAELMYKLPQEAKVQMKIQVGAWILKI